jgi:hypothetical protein
MALLLKSHPVEVRILFRLALVLAVVCVSWLSGFHDRVGLGRLQASLEAAGEDPHAYFNALVARPDHWKSFSLRSQEQLMKYRAADSKPPSVTYDLANDSYPYRQDAAKVLIPAYDPLVLVGGNSISNQVWLPMGTQNGHSYFATWDAWYGDELRREFTDLINWKTFQFDAPRKPGGIGTIWYEMRTRFDLAGPTDVARIDARGYSMPFGPNVTDAQPLSPAAGTFVIKPRTWVRYWAKIEQHASGWELVSLWAADEKNDAVQLIDRLQFEAYEGVTRFRLEFNTSQDKVKVGRGPLVVYVRNFVVLRDVVNEQNLFIRPLAGVPPPAKIGPAPPSNVRFVS